jgi:hypothetical protein
MRIAEYLGEHASRMLDTEPFKSWSVEKSIDDDFEERIIQYVYKQHGLEFHCAADERITVIFLYLDGCSEFEKSLFEIEHFRNREQVLGHFGVPSKSGTKTNHPILGESGAWDRFAKAGFTIHFEYKTNSDAVNKITMMRSDIVPS